MPFALRMVQLLPDLLGSGQGKPVLKGSVVPLSSGPACFEKMSWEDGDQSWTSGAALISVATYLRGNVHLDLPTAWRSVLPKRL